MNWRCSNNNKYCLEYKKKKKKKITHSQVFQKEDAKRNGIDATLQSAARKKVNAHKF